MESLPLSMGYVAKSPQREYMAFMSDGSWGEQN